MLPPPCLEEGNCLRQKAEKVRKLRKRITPSGVTIQERSPDVRTSNGNIQSCGLRNSWSMKASNKVIWMLRLIIELSGDSEQKPKVGEEGLRFKNKFRSRKFLSKHEMLPEVEGDWSISLERAYFLSVVIEYFKPQCRESKIKSIIEVIQRFIFSLTLHLAQLAL